MLAHGARGEVAEGRRHAEALLPLVQALFSEPAPAVLKALLHAEGRLPTPHVRMPLSGASAGGAARALQALATARTG
jgi:4-hydroxy-tetrahydrodipicolinate synthase